MLVADTNLLVYLFLPGDKTADVEALLQRDALWIAPTLWRSEFLNVLTSYHRIKSMPLSRCLAAFEQAEELLMDRTYSVVPLRVLEISSRTGCAGYDAEFLALAEDFSVKLVTYDQKLIDRSAGIACKPSDFSEA